ncbi:hypothetical protein Phou_042670 [Phytohabitans houttuyneae]|uniref:Uncharacterized protein n=1 Tax=Phytohabitans houttuyneae TaxID=1076126 RepID=A0A6V8KEF7_9ACTN|nr:hypothetical protein Phou_042670 [Phytohabitans houttuyneae]
MTAATLAPSAYPPTVDDLLPRARDLATALGEVPSRNRLKRELRIGSPKADTLREILTAELATPPTVEATLAPAAPPADPPAVEIPPAAPVSVLEGNPVDPGANITPRPTVEVAGPTPVTVRRPVAWPVLLLALPAFVAIWAGWVELGKLTGFGKVNLLPGIANVSVDIAITLPIGMETYAAYALWVWLSGRAPPRRAASPNGLRSPPWRSVRLGRSPTT